MKTLSFSLLLLGAACTPAATTSSTATTTAADIPAEREAAKPVKLDAPSGRLLCRAKSATEGTVELYGEGSDGTLRRIVPNGDVETKSVHLEHVRWMVIADERNSTDLAVHAATVREKDGKRYIRLGDWHQAWTACE